MIFCLCYFRQSSFEALISNELFFWNQKSCKPYTIVTASFKSNSIKFISEIDHFCVGLRNRAEKNGNRPIRGISSGMPIEEVQQFLGHVNINTTMVYAQVSRANLKRDHGRYIV